MSESEIVIRELKRKEYQAALELYRKVFFREFEAPDDCVDEVYQGRMTVNSSHYAIPIYHRFGFHDTSLGEALKENRERCHMTQEFVAEAIGVSRQAVSNWETGTSDPSTSNLIALAKLFDVSAEELLRSVEK